MFNHIPPHNLDIEKYILGCMMIDKKCADYIPKLKQSDFFKPFYGEVFEVMATLYNTKESIDIISVSDKLKHIPNAIEVIASMADILTIANFNGHYKKLKQYSLRRELIKRTMEIHEIALNGEYESSFDLKNDAMQKLDISIDETKKTGNSIKNILMTAFDSIEHRHNNKNDEKLYFGLYDLDKVTAGLHSEEMTIIAARPGIGKTAFALKVMLTLANRGNHCLFFSREMSENQIGERIITNLSGVDSQRIRFSKNLTDSDWAKLAEVVGIAADLPIVINDVASTVQEIRSYCRELKNKGMLDVVFIDYLQLCKTSKKTTSREQEVADISREFKIMSKEFGVPVIVLSQLNREIEKQKRRPVLSDLRESGAIEQDADNVLFLHIPFDTDETQIWFDIEIVVAKQRNGPTGVVKVRYSKSNFNFYCTTNRG